MIVRLHNLSARYPVLRDAAAVADLLHMCEGDDVERAEMTEEAITRAWHAENFHLQTDAWVIVSRKGQIVGYAEVRPCADGQFTMLTQVHPDYQGRGIGTLLIWLVEERARQQLLDLCENTRAVLKTTVCSLKQGAHQLLEHEGYTRVHSFWRLLIDMEHIAEQASRGKLHIDMVVDARNSAASTHVLQPTGMYVARQYAIYEKELRSSGTRPPCTDEREPLTV